MRNRKRIIFHIDLDAFFASCEERENPQFRGKPIVVGADPKNGNGRGVVSTANYAARKFGIHSAMPISQAWRLCHGVPLRGISRSETIFLPVNSALYSRVSGSVMKILKDTARKYNGGFAQVGIDEAYLDISTFVYNCRDRDNCIQKIARDIKSKILKRERVTASIGVGPNMLIAKIASDFHKPDGLTIVHPPDVQKFLDPLPIRKLPGIGPKTEHTLTKLGVQTVSDLRKIPQSLLYETFGQHGIALYESARGIDNRIITEETETKSISEEHTFEKDTSSAQEILPIIFALVGGVLRTANDNGFKNFKTITIKIRYADFKTHTKSLSGSYKISDPKEIEKTALKLLLPFLGKQKLRLIGFRIEKFLEK